MKFFIAIALIATVASAAFIKPQAVTGELAEIQEILEAINSPSTNPATAAALEQMLLDILGVNPEPVAVGPAIIPEPIAVGPAIIPEPVYEHPSIEPALVDAPAPVGGGIAGAINPSPVDVNPSPVIVAPSPVAPSPVADVTAPLVQIIVNIQAAGESAPTAPAPVVVPEPVDPVQVAEVAPVAPVDPVQVVEVGPIAPVDPVQVAESAPVPVEPVAIGTPIIPSPAVVLPDDLN